MKKLFFLLLAANVGFFPVAFHDRNAKGFRWV